MPLIQIQLLTSTRRFRLRLGSASQVTRRRVEKLRATRQAAAIENVERFIPLLPSLQPLLSISIGALLSGPLFMSGQRSLESSRVELN